MRDIAALTPQDFGRQLNWNDLEKFKQSASRFHRLVRTMLVLVIAFGILSAAFFFIDSALAPAGMPIGVWIDLVWLGVILIALVLCLPALGVLSQRRAKLELTAKDVRAARRYSKARLKGSPLPPPPMQELPQQSVAPQVQPPLVQGYDRGPIQTPYRPQQPAQQQPSPLVRGYDIGTPILPVQQSAPTPPPTPAPQPQPITSAPYTAVPTGVAPAAVETPQPAAELVSEGDLPAGFCTECGTSLEAGQRFCTECGTVRE